MDAYDDELDVSAEDALLFGDEDGAAGSRAAPELELKPPGRRRHSPELGPRVLAAWRRGDGEPVDREADVEAEGTVPMTAEPLFASAVEEAPVPRRAPLVVEAESGPRGLAAGPGPSEEGGAGLRGAGARVAVAAGLGVAGVAAAALVISSLGGERSSASASAVPVPTATPAPVTRTVTVTAPPRPRKRPTSPRPAAKKRGRAKRPVAVRRAVVPAPARPAVRAPAVRVYRAPAYRAPSSGSSADAAFGVRTP